MTLRTTFLLGVFALIVVDAFALSPPSSPNRAAEEATAAQLLGKYVNLSDEITRLQKQLDVGGVLPGMRDQYNAKIKNLEFPVLLAVVASAKIISDYRRAGQASVLLAVNTGIWLCLMISTGLYMKTAHYEK